MLADGGEAIADLPVLRDQPGAVRPGGLGSDHVAVAVAVGRDDAGAATRGPRSGPRGRLGSAR